LGKVASPALPCPNMRQLGGVGRGKATWWDGGGRATPLTLLPSPYPKGEG